MKKRILPALLALCMVMSLLPVTVFAEEGDSSGTPTATKCDCTDTGCTNQNHSNAAQGTQCSQDVAEGKSKCEGCQSYADSKDDNKDDEGEDTPTPAAKCATCQCDLSVCTECKAATEDPKADAVCGCAADPCGAPGCNKTKCTNKACDNFDKVVDVPHTCMITKDCAAGRNNNGTKTECTKATHETDCGNVCGVLGCTKTKGHVENGEDDTAKKHSVTDKCTHDKGCAVDANDPTKHQAGCPVIAKVEADETHRVATFEKTYDLYLACACTTHKADGDKEHGAGSSACPNDVASEKGPHFTYTVKFDFQYEIKMDSKDSTKVDEAATEAPTNKKPSEAQITAAKKAAEDVLKTKNEGALCPTCAKAVAGVQGKECTGAVRCPVPADGKHKDDCLSLCTHNDSCGNSVGVPEAHQIWYRVEKIVANDNNEVKGTYADRADAVALLNSLRAAAEEAESNDKYQLIAVHCPKAGVADSTVLGADDEVTTEPTDPEDKAPEKAEDFTDVAADAWYAEELTALMEKKVFVGNADKTFNPTGNVTGAELVVLLSRVAGEELVTTGAEWNKAATEWAAEAGYTEGLEVTTTEKLTRQDVILVLWRAAGKPESEQSLEDFADAEGLEGDYLSAMKWAVEKEIIKGDGDTGALKADANITRAEMVAVLTRYDKAVNAK